MADTTHTLNLNLGGDIVDRLSAVEKSLEKQSKTLKDIETNYGKIENLIKKTSGEWKEIVGRFEKISGFNLAKPVLELAVQSANATRAIEGMKKGLDAVSQSGSKTLLTVVDIAKTLNAFNKGVTMRIVFSDQEALKGIAKLQDKLSDLIGFDQAKGLMEGLAAEITPGQERVIANVIKKWESGVISIDQLGKELANRGVKNAGLTLENIIKNQATIKSDPTIQMQVRWENLKKRIDKIFVDLALKLGTAFGPQLDKISDAVMKVAAFIEKWASKFLDLSGGMQLVVAAAAVLLPTLAKIEMTLAASKATSGGVTTELERQTAEIRRQTVAMRELIALQSKAGAGGVPAGMEGMYTQGASAGTAALAAKPGAGSFLRGGFGKLGLSGILMTAGAGFAAGETGREIAGSYGAGTAGKNLAGIGSGALGGAAAGFAMGGPAGAAAGALVGAFTEASKAVYDWASYTNEANKLQKEIAEGAKKIADTQNREWTKIVKDPKFKEAQDKMALQFANLVPELEKSAKAKFSEKGMKGENLQTHVAEEVNTEIAKRTKEGVIEYLRSQGIAGQTLNRIAAMTGTNVEDFINPVVQASRAQATGAAGATGGEASEWGTRLAGLTAEGAAQAQALADTFKQPEQYIAGAVDELTNFSDLMTKMGPTAEIGGRSLKTMFGENLQSIQAVREEEEKNIKTLLDERQIGLDAARKIGDRQGELAIMKEMSQAQGYLNSLEMMHVKTLELALQPLEMQSKLAEQNTQTSETLLHISEGLYGTAALNISASMQVVENINKEIDTLQERLNMAESLTEEQKKQPAIQEKIKALNIEILQKQEKQVQLVQKLRDGYLSSIAASATSAGRFSRIIIDQEKNLGISGELGMRRKNYLLGGETSKVKSYRMEGMGNIRDSSGRLMSTAEAQEERLAQAGLEGTTARTLSNVYGAAANLPGTRSSLNEYIKTYAPAAGMGRTYGSVPGGVTRGLAVQGTYVSPAASMPSSAHAPASTTAPLSDANASAAGYLRRAADILDSQSEQLAELWSGNATQMVSRENMTSNQAA